MTQLENHPTGPIDPFTDRSLPNPVRTAGRRDWQRISLFAGGILFAVGNLLHPLEHNDAAYPLRDLAGGAPHDLLLASAPRPRPALPPSAAHDAHLPEACHVAVAASVVGLIGIAPGTIIETFVAPMIGHHAMEELESGGMGVVNGLLGVAYLGGTIALGWAVSRARLRPRWAGPSLIVSAVVLLGVMSATGPAAGVVIISRDGHLRSRPGGSRRQGVGRPNEST